MGKRILSNKPISVPICFFVFLLLFSSCIATQQDILALNRQIQTLSSQIYKLEGVREKQADVGAEVDTVRQELQRLTGILEENRHLVKHAVERDTLEQDMLNARLAGLEEKVAQLYKHLNLEPKLATQKQPSKGGPRKAAVVTPQPPVQEEALASPEKALYQEALATYHEGKYKDAISGFKSLIKIYPKSNLADNAQFWIGESYLALKKYELAIQAYHEVITTYPEGNKVPNAMLKQALAFIEAKDDVAAKIVLKNLIKKYPDSDESKIAEAKLNTLK
jgi:tol-pal system protein YbgF